jgi:hypothetical protein
VRLGDRHHRPRSRHRTSSSPAGYAVDRLSDLWPGRLSNPSAPSMEWAPGMAWLTARGRTGSTWSATPNARIADRASGSRPTRVTPSAWRARVGWPAGAAARSPLRLRRSRATSSRRQGAGNWSRSSSSRPRRANLGYRARSPEASNCAIAVNFACVDLRGRRARLSAANSSSTHAGRAPAEVTTGADYGQPPIHLLALAGHGPLTRPRYARSGDALGVAARRVRAAADGTAVLDA